MGYSDIKEMLKDAKNIATGANDLHLKSLLLDIQDKVFELQEENKELREEIHDLKNDKIMESQLEYKDGYYVRNTDGRIFCSKCWDSEKKLISTLEAEYGKFCPVCDNYVG
ncbi:MAG: hypothetical protein ACLRKY_10795 [Enterococcus gallinarum]|uniref:hypothetical protein n=1 Tax=Enterococcus gallinarum TaxID=1353 RepID=UPI001898EDE5|nr:hypothetical protein [Enterococcus gallinarum]